MTGYKGRSVPTGYQVKMPSFSNRYKYVITLGSIAIFSHHDSRRVIKLNVQDLVYHL